ncbi:MAG TPA: glycerol-3-phosphate acyltransferase [Gaiellaceae bacterium]|nr:glycerol-3-phosphate acyltransferase [Gaiellaceae bacterium]
MATAALLVGGYILGSCPWGYWLVRAFRGDDIRREGSGNIGGTNVWRSYGASFGLPVLALDFLKGFVPAILGVLFVSHPVGAIAGTLAMLGHWRPLFLRFARGGKMVATGGGVFFAIAPLVAATSLLIWGILFWTVGFASVASVTAALLAPLEAWLYDYPLSAKLFSFFAAFGTAYLHRSNFERLRAGTELRSGIALVTRLRAHRT